MNSAGCQLSCGFTSGSSCMPGSSRAACVLCVCGASQPWLARRRCFLACCSVPVSFLIDSCNSRPGDENLTLKEPKSNLFLWAHLAVLFKADSAVQRKQKYDHPKYFYLLCCAEISTFTYKKHEKNFCSDFDSERANQPDDPKSEPNLPSDQKVDFSRNWVSRLGLLQSQVIIPWP